MPVACLSWPPCGVLGRPENRNSGAPSFLLPAVRVLHVEAHRCCPSCRSRREVAPLVVASVVPMQNDASRRSPDNDDDVIPETDREAKGLGVKRLRFAEVSDIQNQAGVVINFHARMLARPSDALPLISGRVLCLSRSVLDRMPVQSPLSISLTSPFQDQWGIRSPPGTSSSDRW